MYQQQQQQQQQYTMDNDGLYKAVMIPSINNPSYYHPQQYNGMVENDEQGQLAALSAGNLYAQHLSHPSNYDLTMSGNQMNSFDNLVLNGTGAAWRATPYDMLMISSENEAYNGGHGPVQLPNGKTLQYQENVSNSIYQGLEPPAPQMMPPPVPTQPIIHSQTSLDYYGSPKMSNQTSSVPINRPVMVGTIEGQMLPSFRYSPDEGYAEENSPPAMLQGTEV